LLSWAVAGFGFGFTPDVPSLRSIFEMRGTEMLYVSCGDALLRNKTEPVDSMGDSALGFKAMKELDTRLAEVLLDALEEYVPALFAETGEEVLGFIQFARSAISGDGEALSGLEGLMVRIGDNMERVNFCRALLLTVRKDKESLQTAADFVSGLSFSVSPEEDLLEAFRRQMAACRTLYRRFLDEALRSA
jgi:hypothetical protein